MSDPSVSERRIKPIQDAVDSENWKQALQLCEKWHKKGEKSDRFQAIKAFVLVRQQDAATHQRGAQETVQLCRRTPAITDVEALHQIHDILKDLSLFEDEGTKLWDRAVASKPDDKDLAKTWLNRSITENNWLDAQKAAMALRKSFPKDRNYDFWNILMCYLINTDISRTEKERTLFGTLAYRMISKAAEGVPTEKDQLLSSGKALQTPEELYLLVKIYLSTGHANEATKLLQSDNLGLKSRFAKQDPQLVIALLLESLEDAGALKEASAHCSDLLKQQQQEVTAGTKDDGEVWSLFVRATKNSYDPASLKAAEDFVRDTLGKNNDPRNAHRALLSILEVRDKTTESHATLLQACESYWQRFCGKAYCFEDLRTSISSLDRPSQMALLKQMSKEVVADKEKTEARPDASIPALNALKFRYCFSLAIETSNEDLEHFAYDALKMYQKYLDTPSPCPEAGLLAAMALVRLASYPASMFRNDQHLLRAVFVLETCRALTKDYYPYSLLLLQIKSLLGLMSLVMREFQGLNIKNMQWETTGHLLLSRISTSHPHMVGTSAPLEARFEPLKALGVALTVSENSEDSLSTQIRSGLNHGSYVNVVESVRMRSDLKHSMSKQIFVHEGIRIKQLFSLPDVDSIPPQPVQLVDNRDFSYLPSYEAPGAIEFGEYLRHGPLPRKQWLKAVEMYNQTICLMKGELSGHRVSTETEPELLQRLLLATKDAEMAQSTELTAVEVENLQAHILLTKGAIAAKDISASETQSMDEVILQIEKWLKERAPNANSTARHASEDDLVHFNAEIQAPSWNHLHRSFSLLETLQGISLFLTVLSKKPKNSKSKAQAAVPKERLSELRKLLTDVEAGVHDEARRLKAEINKPGVLGKLMDIGMGRNEEDDLDPVGKVLEQLADAATLETFCGEMRDSWEDALDGILAVKVKVPK